MIGTTVCALPAVHALAAAWPTARLQLLGYHRVSELLLDEPVAQHLHLLDRKAPGPGLTAWLASAPRPDVALDLLSTPESAAALAAAGVPCRVGWPGPGEGPGPTVAVPFPGERHQQSVQDYLDFLVAVGLPAAAAAPTLTAGEACRAAARSWLDAAGAPASLPLHVLGLGGGNARKRWPLPRYLDLAAWLEARTGGRTVFCLGPEEDADADALRRARPGAIVAHRRPLDQVKGLLALADLAVCNDHALMHLSAALGVPTVGVFLASDPAEWFPYGPPACAVIGPPLPCRPCYVEDCPGWACNDPSLWPQVLAALEPRVAVLQGARAG